jgi:hypothetical protein
MNTDSDQDWLDAVAGREHTPTNAALAEGLFLRKAMQVHLSRQSTAEHATAASIARIDPMRERTLIERARRDGLLSARASWRPMLIAAAISMLAVGIGWQTFMRTETDAVRAGADAPAQLEARDPAALKRQITEELRAAGVAATGYESLGVHGIDADLPLPISSAVRSVLARHGIAVPADGVLRIEIREAR